MLIDGGWRAIAAAPGGMLAQVSRLLPEVRPLPEPPLLQRLLFETPLWPALVLGALGVLMLFGLGTRGRGAAGIWALAGAWILAGAVLGAGTLVTTDRERLMGLTRRAVEATAGAETAGLRPLLHERVRVVLPDRVPAASPDGRSELLSAVERVLGSRYRVDSWRITGLQASVDGEGLARTQVGVSARASGSGPIVSWWLLDWREVGGSWVIVGLELVSMPILGIGTQESGPV